MGEKMKIKGIDIGDFEKINYQFENQFGKNVVHIELEENQKNCFKIIWLYDGLDNLFDKPQGYFKKLKDPYGDSKGFRKIYREVNEILLSYGWMGA